MREIANLVCAKAFAGSNPVVPSKFGKQMNFLYKLFTPCDWILGQTRKYASRTRAHYKNDSERIIHEFKVHSVMYIIIVVPVNICIWTLPLVGLYISWAVLLYWVVGYNYAIKMHNDRVKIMGKLKGGI